MHELCVPAEAQKDTVRVDLARVTKRFGRRRVLRGVTASVEQGGVLGVAGANGSGKSTLMRIIAGLLAPDQGECRVELNGRSLDRFARRAIIGWVSPETGLYASLTGAEHLRLYGDLRGVRPSRKSVALVLDKVGLSSRGDDLVRTYSSGMRQRLRYACALIHEPLVLLLDEPFNNLDDDGVEIVRRLVEVQRNRGVTVVAGNEARELDLADVTIHLGYWS